MARTLTLAMLFLASAAAVPALAIDHDRHQGDGSFASSQEQPWHAMYYNADWGIPVAVVVPPTARYQAHEGWGVGGVRVTPLRAQFKRNFPGYSMYDRKLYQPTPRWPSDTDQLGYYYVRGPRQ